jgi:DNA-directed RNA polymerase subunit RPC12/RpoP
MEREEKHPYKCAICGEKFDSQDQLQQHLRTCTKKQG